MYGRRYRREVNRPSRSRRTCPHPYCGSYNPSSWFYSIYGDTERRPRASERDRRFRRTEENGTQPADIETATDADLVKVIHVKNVDLQVGQNALAHRTDEYDIVEEREDDSGKTHKAELVVRRGQTFDLTLSFNRDYDINTDDVTLVFSIGDFPVTMKKTLVRIPMSETAEEEKTDPFSWSAKMTSQIGSNISVSVRSAADCIIGEWELTVQTTVEENSDGARTFEYKQDMNVYILLNPWCPDDAVYMSTSELLDEYVLNETGYQYYGNHRQIGAMPWLFGQFEEGVLEVSLSLLRLAFDSGISEKMADPVKIARALSAAVNVQDDSGVLVGNWSGDYSGGSSPTSWNGSAAILQQYSETGEPVKFGQCWVFSGVLTTVCRALGLPARSVTNFKSAHDADESVSIDKYYELGKDDQRESISSLNRDSIWNFHVWNDVWMARRDLGEGFDGWQALDATPQETSGGKFVCGPCPVSAIKNGDISIPYDGVFIFTEVNGHVVNWMRTGATGQDWEATEVDKKTVGQNMSTKTPLSHVKSDVTHEYKYKDGTNKEEKIMSRVAKYLGQGSRAYLVQPKDCKIVMADRDGIVIGSPFDVTATVTNVIKEPRTVNVYLVATVTTYTGQVTRTIKSENNRGITLQPGEDKTVSMDVSFDEYYPHLVEGAAMKVSVECMVKENKQTIKVEDDFRLRKPALTLTTDGSYKVKEPLYVTFSFTNPLQVALTQCTAKMDARGIAGGSKIITPKQQNVQPGELFSETVEIVPRRPGKKEIVATFEALELLEISGSVSVIIKK